MSPDESREHARSRLTAAVKALQRASANIDAAVEWFDWSEEEDLAAELDALQAELDALKGEFEEAATRHLADEKRPFSGY